MGKILLATGVSQDQVKVLPPPNTSNRSPISNDTNFDIGQIWFNKNTGQFYIYQGGTGSDNWILFSGSLPPAVATQYVTDVNSPAIPAANILNEIGRSTTANNNNGVRTDGSSGSNTLTIQLTNRLQGTTSTVGAVTSVISSFTPTIIGTYAIEYRVAAYNTTGSLGAGYSIFGTARFDGTDSNLCGTADKITNEEGSMTSANVTMTNSSGAILVNGVGYAGQTINWSAVGLYTFVGV
ncbi:MAG TPA: hypothetical protein VHZ50_16445 [Puia sp.]|jgi:hypothetical protein|nr:hypothetical protein [Puia sp.]